MIEKITAIGEISKADAARQKIAENTSASLFQETKESSEIPELDDENFKAEGIERKNEITDVNWIKAKVNKEGDIREYIEGDHVWQQLFTRESVVRETKKAGKQPVVSCTVYQDIIERKYHGNYQDFLIGEKIAFCGLYHANRNEFEHIGHAFYFWCQDNSVFYGRGTMPNTAYWNKFCAFSVRCAKSAKSQ